jgi:hypothetical protein
MGKLTNTPGRSFVLETLLVLYAVASLVHFVHNAEFVEAYPNLPSWITRSSVYVTWAAIAAIGLLGYLLHRNGFRVVGVLLLLLYAAIGLDGLLHYTRAPIAAHSLGMNFSVWFEVMVAAILLGYLALGFKRLTSDDATVA